MFGMTKVGRFDRHKCSPHFKALFYHFLAELEKRIPLAFYGHQRL